MLHLIILVAVGIFTQQSFADEPEAIVGGQPAAPGEFPYQCSLTKNGYHFCGCSILSPTHVLTAAHCVYGSFQPPYRNLLVQTGHIQINVGENHKVREVYCHPQYIHEVKHSWVNDIAVIQLESPITYNSMQRPVTLPTGPPTDRTRCVLSGWGMTRARGPLAQTLLKMHTFIHPRHSCQAAHGLSIFQNQVCALTGKGIGACQGDSGGPLVCNGQQIGVTSWSSPCALGIPDVYTSVYHHLDFIKQAMRY